MRVLVVLFVLVGCGADGEGFGVQWSPDGAVVGKGRAVPTDAEADDVGAGGAGGGMPDAMAVVIQGGSVGTVPISIPDSIVPRRAGIACERDEQCGEHAGKCFDGVCTTCAGPQCGVCASGAVKGVACPVRGFTASACSHCRDDDRLWCDSETPCPTGPCVSPDCR